MRPGSSRSSSASSLDCPRDEDRLQHGFALFDDLYASFRQRAAVRAVPIENEEGQPMNHPRLRSALFAGLAVLAVGRSSAFGIDPDWEAVEKIFGKPAKVQPDGVRRFGWPRTDLHVTRDSVAIEPTLALGSWAAFAAMPNGEAMAMGDLVLLGTRSIRSSDALQAGGAQVLAIHNHLIGETPQILYLHFSATGPAAAVATALKTALERTATPLTPAAAAPAPSPSETASLPEGRGSPRDERAPWPGACSRSPCRAPKRCRRTECRFRPAWAWPLR